VSASTGDSGVALDAITITLVLQHSDEIPVLRIFRKDERRWKVEGGGVAKCNMRCAGALSPSPAGPPQLTPLQVKLTHSPNHWPYISHLLLPTLIVVNTTSDVAATAPEAETHQFGEVFSTTHLNMSDSDRGDAPGSGVSLTGQEIPATSLGKAPSSEPPSSEPPFRKPRSSEPPSSKAPPRKAPSSKAPSRKPAPVYKEQKKDQREDQEDEEDEEEEGGSVDSSRSESSGALDTRLSAPKVRAGKELKAAKLTIRHLKDRVRRRDRKIANLEGLVDDLTRRLIYLGRGKSTAFVENSPVDAAHEVRDLALFHADMMKCFMEKALNKDAHKLDRLVQKSWYNLGSVAGEFQQYLDEVLMAARMYTIGFYITLEGEQYRLATSEDSKTDTQAIRERLLDFAVRPKDFRGVLRGNTEFESAQEISEKASARAEGLDLSDSESESESENSLTTLSDDDEEDIQLFVPDRKRLPRTGGSRKRRSSSTQ
jgi:hypothetical protein